jgi:hypothetical protein
MTDEISPGVSFYELLQLYVHGIDSLSPVLLHFSDFSDWWPHTTGRRAEPRDKQVEYRSQRLQGARSLALALARKV